MKALIFNAGRGSRLGELTAHCPKGLVPLIHGDTLFSRQLRLLAAVGIHDVVLTTGYLGEQFREAVQAQDELGLRFQFADNPDYATSNSVLSMERAAHLLQDDDFIVLHGDVVFDEVLLTQLVAAPAANMAAVDATPPINEKDFKGRLCDGRVVDIAVDIHGKDCVNLMPLFKFSREAMAMWLEQVHAACTAGRTDIYAETALRPVLAEMNLQPLSYAGHLLMEVDTREELAYARAVLEEQRL